MKERALRRSPGLIADPANGPRLLVSVRSSDEALAAMNGGADILDAKEPSRGSLGIADIAVITDIARRVSNARPSTPLSMALGELADWRGQEDIPSLPSGVQFAKLGLHGCQHQSGWRAEWLRLRTLFEQQSQSQIEWVAVAYADADEAAAPDIGEILHAAMETNCTGLLVDTFSKNGRSLLDWLESDSLSDLAERCHGAGLFFALAGSLRRESLRELSAVAADVIAIRSAACVGDDRKATVSEAAIASFHDELRRCFAHRTETSSPPLLLANR